MRKNKLGADEFQSLKSYHGIKSVNFDDALEDFCVDRKRKGTRDSTIRYYLREITVLRRFIIREKDGLIPVSDIDVKLLDDWITWLRDVRKNKVGGINAKIRAVRAFLFFCEEVGYLADNPAEDWKQIRAKEPVIYTFTSRQLNALLKQVDRRKFTGLRNYVLMMTLLDTGVRISEALGVEVGDVIMQENRIFIRNTKNDFSRYVPMSDMLKNELKQFLRIHDGMSEKVFCNLRGTALRYESAGEIIRKYGVQAGLKGVRCSPHTFRHTFAKMYILNGGDVFSLMQIMGHTDMEMTRRYVRLFSADINKKHRQFSPLQNL